VKKLSLLLVLLNALTIRAAELPSIAVADFSSDQNTRLTHGLPDILTDALVNSHRFDVYEREKLNTIMKEQSFQASGFSDPQTAVALGKVAGVHYILTGQIIDYGHEVRTFTGYGVNTRTTFYRLKAGIKVVDVKTGKVLFSRNDSAEEKLDEGQSMQSYDTTMDTKLAEEVSDKLVKALLNDESFKGPDDGAGALIPVKISSTPENADVEVDGVFYGNAGGDIKLPSGLHLVKVSLTGYEDWSKKVMVKEGLVFNVALTKKVDARIEIKHEN
jgi:hypothetical protein